VATSGVARPLRWTTLRLQRSLGSPAVERADDRAGSIRRGRCAVAPTHCRVSG
jgi:hypothetical protein